MIEQVETLKRLFNRLLMAGSLFCILIAIRIQVSPYMKRILLLLSMSFPMFSLAQEIAIIPQPVSVQNVPGGSFVLNKAQTVFLSPVNETTQALAGYLTDHVASQTGLQLRVSDVEAPDGNAAGLQLRLRSGKANLGEEGYTLNASATGPLQIFHLSQHLKP